MVEPIAKAIGPKKFSDDNLRLCVLAFDCRHILASCFGGVIHRDMNLLIGYDFQNLCRGNNNRCSWEMFQVSCY